jgi:hypothetical protein
MIHSLARDLVTYSTDGKSIHLANDGKRIKFGRTMDEGEKEIFVIAMVAEPGLPITAFCGTYKNDDLTGKIDVDLRRDLAPVMRNSSPSLEIFFKAQDDEGLRRELVQRAVNEAPACVVSGDVQILVLPAKN